MREWEKMCAEWATRKKQKITFLVPVFYFDVSNGNPFVCCLHCYFKSEHFFFCLARTRRPTINQFGVLFVGTGAVCVICWTICWNRAQGSRSDGSLRMVIVHEFWVACRTAERRQKNVFCWWFFFRLLLHWLSSELELWNVFLVRLRPPASWITELVTKHFIR